MNNFNLTATYTDLYQINMGQVYFLKNKINSKAVFDYYFRKIPFKGGYVVFSGIQSVLNVLKDYQFSTEDINFLQSLKLNEKYLKYLESFRFNGSIYAVREGNIIFPNCPAVRVEGNIIEAQLIETMLLNLLNFESLIATKAARMRSVAGNKILSEFGLRRAQGLGAYHATRASIIGGCNNSSNVMGARDFNLSPSGTMAHSFIQSYDDELKAFRDFADTHPHYCVLLVDTYNTLESGVPNAITVAKELEQQGCKLLGIRLDSGDLAYLAKRARHMLDEAGLQYVKIVASNQLDEFVIKSLQEQGAPIDIYGVGTRLVTGQPDAALDGVYKLSSLDEKPRIKLSENIGKTTLPGIKQVLRVFDNHNYLFGADVVAMKDEKSVSAMFDPFDPYKNLSLKGLRQQPLLELVWDKGKPVQEPLALEYIQQYSQEQLQSLPAEYKRFDNPHKYKVGISGVIRDLRENLIADHRQRVQKMHKG